mgnify:CR=1 FL=1
MIGTSAGGIVGLAISKGIDYKQIHEILESMKKVPEKNNLRPHPSYYEEKMKYLKRIFKMAFKEYGLINETLYEQLISLL